MTRTTEKRPIPGFDCVAFKNEAQARMLVAMRGMSHEEELAYLRERAHKGPLRDVWERLRPHIAPDPH